LADGDAEIAQSSPWLETFAGLCPVRSTRLALPLFVRTCSPSARITTHPRPRQWVTSNGITSGQRRPTSDSFSSDRDFWRPPMLRQHVIAPWTTGYNPEEVRFLPPPPGSGDRWCSSKVPMVGLVLHSHMSLLAVCAGEATHRGGTGEGLVDLIRIEKCPDTSGAFRPPDVVAAYAGLADRNLHEPTPSTPQFGLSPC